MEEKKKKNYVIPVIGALIAVVACVAYIVMKSLHHNSNSLRTSGANMTTAVGCNFSK